MTFLKPLALFCLTALLPVVAFATGDTEAPRQQAAAQKTTVTIKRLVFADTAEAALAIKNSLSADGVYVTGLPFFDNKVFKDAVSKHLGSPIANETVNKIAEAVTKFVRDNDRLTAHLTIPQQNANDGTLCLVLALGRYKDISVKGNRWFSKELLADKLGVKPGDEIRVSTLEKGVNWVNASPFRRVTAVIDNVKGDPTNVGLILAVQERMPLRFVTSYDNSNVHLLGEHRYTGAIEYANLWGIDHDVTYQFCTTRPVGLYQLHSLNYKIPLPWRHHLQLLGAYARVNPSFAGGLITQIGQNVVGSAKYIVPWSKGNYIAELSGGVDFKQSNNNLEFGGKQFNSTKYDVVHAVLTATLIRKDSLGNWSATLNCNISPGELTPRNQDEIFHKSRPDAQDSYMTASLVLQRSTNLPNGWGHTIRGNFQTATENLQGSEQMSIGGAGTVRGYSERICSGDMGYTLTSELMTPVKTITLPKKWLKEKKINARGLVFFDCGEVSYLHKVASDVSMDPLMSTGVGIRCSAENFISFSFDYGWTWKRPSSLKLPGSGRAHMQATIAF